MMIVTTRTNQQQQRNPQTVSQFYDKKWRLLISNAFFYLEEAKENRD